MNHILLYKCVFSYNRKDGIKTKDYRVEVIGCVIQLNVLSAMQVADEQRGSATLYLKSKKNEKDFIGRFMGESGRYRPQIVVD